MSVASLYFLPPLCLKVFISEDKTLDESPPFMQIINASHSLLCPCPCERDSCVCVWTLPVQLPIVLSSLVSLYFLELTDVLSPAMVGFRCHDRDLSMPYVETGDELIPLLMLLSLAFAGPAASVSARNPPQHLADVRRPCGALGSRRQHRAGGV